MKLHIAIGQYEFVEIEMDNSRAQELRPIYERIKSEFIIGEGIPDKEMDEVICLMLKGETVRNGIEIYQRMDAQQQKECQRIKRLKARTSRSANKQEKATTNHLKELQ